MGGIACLISYLHILATPAERERGGSWLNMIFYSNPLCLPCHYNICYMVTPITMLTGGMRERGERRVRERDRETHTHTHRETHHRDTVRRGEGGKREREEMRDERGERDERERERERLSHNKLGLSLIRNIYRFDNRQNYYRYATSIRFSESNKKLMKTSNVLMRNGCISRVG